MAGCGSSISQEEYDRINDELSEARLQVAELQEKLDEAAAAEAQYEQLNTEYQELKKQYDAQSDELKAVKSDFDELNAKYEQLKGQGEAGTDEMQALQAEYDELSQQYAELKRQYDIIVQGEAVFSEEEIEQAIFELVNQERKNNGLDELEWGPNLYKWAKQNSREMAEKGEYMDSDWSSWQDIYIAAGHATLDGLASSALTIWKNQNYNFKQNFLNPQSPYGTVAAYKLGDAYYITYMASPFR
jgi:seryl-tRNA synthetase